MNENTEYYNRGAKLANQALRQVDTVVRTTQQTRIAVKSFVAGVKDTLRASIEARKAAK